MQDSVPQLDAEQVTRTYERLECVRKWVFRGAAALWVASMVVVVVAGGSGTWALAPIPALVFMPVIEWLVGRRHRRIVAGLPPRPEPEPKCAKCANCGYILIHLETNRCPECNWAFDPRFERTVSEDDRVRWHAGMGVLTSSILLFGYLLSMGILGRSAGLLWAAGGGMVGVILVVFLTGRRAMKRLRVEMPLSLPCPKCEKAISVPADNQCPHCGHELLAEDFFLPVKPWNLADARYRQMRRKLWLPQGALIASFFALAGCGVWYAKWGWRTLTPIERGLLPGAICAAGLVLWLVRRSVHRRFGRKHSLLFSMAAPTCLHCHEDLTGRPLNGQCPSCERTYDSSVLTG